MYLRMGLISRCGIIFSYDKMNRICKKSLKIIQNFCNIVVVHLPGCKICLIAFPLFSALKSDYIQWHKFNVSGTAAANKATQISSCPIGSGICTIYKGRSGKGRLLADQEKLLLEEKAMVSSSLLHCGSSTFGFSGLSLILRNVMPLPGVCNAFSKGIWRSLSCNKLLRIYYSIVSFPYSIL